MNIAFDLDDTLIDTGNTIIRILEAEGFSIADYREPYNSLRALLDDKVISPEDYDLIFATAVDNAEVIPTTVAKLKEVISTYGKAHVVSTRSYTNSTQTLEILGKVLTLDELYKVQIHWCKAPSAEIKKALELQGTHDAKLGTFKYLAGIGVTHFMDDLMFNVRTLLENVAEITPILVHQPWVEDRLYVPELINDPRVLHQHL